MPPCPSLLMLARPRRVLRTLVERVEMCWTATGPSHPPWGRSYGFSGGPHLFLASLLIAFMGGATTTAHGQLQEDNVLVLYNSQGMDTNGSGRADSVDIFQYYQSVHPGVIGFDFDDASLSAGTIAYADYVSKVRDPLRAFLTRSDLESQISVFTTTRGLPHRIEDLNLPALGDQPSLATDVVAAGNASYATVDSELALIWQPLQQGEANDTMDSYADNMVANPYFNIDVSIQSFDRSQIAREQSFGNLGDIAWQMQDTPSETLSDAGHIYLSARLDGNSVSDVQRMIDRGRYASYNQFEDLLLFDENTAGDLDDYSLFENDTIGYLGDDYDNAYASFQPRYEKIRFNEDSRFLIGPEPFAGDANTEVVDEQIGLLASFGGNHGGDATGYVQSFDGHFSNGAIMNTTESYNARQLGGLDGYGDQGQVADFIAAGGTFAVGQSWEPFAFSLPDNEVLIENFLFHEDLTWVEAAWASVPWISWQQIVFGDPLAKATLILDPQAIVWQGSNDGSGEPGDNRSWSDAKNWVRNALVDTAFQHGDTAIFSAPNGGPITLEGPQIVQSLLFSSDGYALRGSDLAVRTGEITVRAGSTATIESNLFATRGLSKQGAGTLIIDGAAPSTTVVAGTLAGNGTINGLDVQAGARVRPGGESDIGRLTITGDFTQSAGGATIVSLETGSSSLVEVLGTATLAGDLRLTPLSNHQSPNTRGEAVRFSILEAEEVSGAFDAVIYDDQTLDIVASSTENVQIGHVGDGLFQIVEYGSGVTVTSYLAVTGDANGDRMVDADDFTIWNANRFTSGTDWTRGDFNQDGTTDVTDFNLWHENFGTNAAGSAVPEPSPSFLLVVGVAVLVRRRWS